MDKKGKEPILKTAGRGRRKVVQSRLTRNGGQKAGGVGTIKNRSVTG